jgi:5-formyltetrahydrofolate cyclo-ligase
MLRNDTVKAEKAALRQLLRAELNKITPTEREAASRQACTRLEQQPVWQKAKSVLFYAPTPEEVDVWPLLVDSLSAGKAVFLPRYDVEEKTYVVCRFTDAVGDLRAGQFGIREPHETCAKISSNRLDLILVPGLGFDLAGHRLGRGKGFYDQLLTALQGTTCGVAFDQQIVARVPAEPHDIRLSCILTPTRWSCASDPRAVLK